MNDFVGYIDSEGKIFDGTFDYEGRVGPIGPQGPAGYTPVRGTDYWTEADINYVVTEATSLINGKLEEYNNNATEKLAQFNTNATNKTEAFNDNASSKTNDFNSNASAKTTAFNENAAALTTQFDNNAASKLSDYNLNATDKTTTFNNNATSQTTTFDAHVDSEFNELTGNFYTKTQTYSKAEVDGKVASTYHYKGSVTDYTYLPSTGQQVGDVWNIEQAGGGYNAGDNVGWTGTGWDALAGTVDLSSYYNKSETDALLGGKQNTLTEGDGIDITNNTISVDGKPIKLLSSNVDTMTIAEGLYIVDAQITVTMAGNNATTMYKGEMLTAELSNTGSVVRLYQANVVKTYYYTTVEGEISFVTVATMETTNNKKTSMPSTPTDTQYPSLKLLNDLLVQKQAEIDQLTDQIPTNEVSGDNINIQDSSNLPIQEFDMLGNATQADTPTPDSPQDIHVVTGDNTVKVLGKNWFNPNDTYYYRNSQINVTISGNTISFTSNYTLANNYIWWNIPVTIGQNLTISYSNMAELTGNDNNRVSYHFSDVPNTTIGTAPTITDSIGKTSKKRTITATAKYLILILRTANGVNGYTISDLMVEVGDTATPYTPYIAPTTQLISLGSIELAKIGDYTDRIFKDNGKWYKEENVQKLILDGTYPIPKKSSTTDNDRFVFDIYNTTIPLCWTNTNSLCNRFVYNASNTVPSWRNNDNGSQIIVNYTAYGTTTLEQFKTWLSSNNLILYQPLKTPTTTEITDTTLIAQLENILAMHTNKNVTNAWIEPTGTNAQAGLTLTYYRDLETVISNLQNQIDIIST